MKHINNETEFIVILTKEEIQNLMACCNAASLRWKTKSDEDHGWKILADIADKCWSEMHHILNPEKEV